MVAAQTGVVMLIYLDQAVKAMKAACGAQGRPFTRPDLYQAIMFGAVERVRPKVMTVAAITAGLVPILWSTGAGSEVMQRIAVPMIGGMVSSTALTLVVIPAVYALVKGYRLPAAAHVFERPPTPEDRVRQDYRLEGFVETPLVRGHHSTARRSVPESAHGAPPAARRRKLLFNSYPKAWRSADHREEPALVAVFRSLPAAVSEGWGFEPLSKGLRRECEQIIQNCVVNCTSQSGIASIGHYRFHPSRRMHRLG